MGLGARPVRHVASHGRRFEGQSLCNRGHAASSREPACPEVHPAAVAPCDGAYELSDSELTDICLAVASQRLQELDEIEFLIVRQRQSELLNVVIDDRWKILCAAVVEVRRMLPERAQRRRAVFARCGSTR